MNERRQSDAGDTRQLVRRPISAEATAFRMGGTHEETRRGLRLFASVLGGVCVASFGLQFLGEVVLGTLAWSASDWIRESAEALSQGGLAFALFRAAGMRTLSTSVKRGLALALYVLYVGISTFYDVLYLDTTNFAIRPGWTCLAILMYALLAPGSTRHHALVASAATVSVPLGATLAWVAGLLPDAGSGRPAFATTATSALVGMTPSLVCAVVAMFVVTASRRRAQRMEAMERKLQSLGSYRLVRRLGVGGMGEVWRAEHAFLATPAAIKLIRPELLHQRNDYENPNTLLQRFSREANAIARLSSQNTVRLFDFGSSDEGTFFLVMEMLDGEDLDTIVRRTGPLPQERVVHLLRQACDSLGEAHEAGLIHRDVKPANLFVCRKGRRYDVLKVLDFGLALTLDSADEPWDEGSGPRLTAEGLVQGTAWYMAPEQAMSGEGLDHRVDLYALGCVAYFLLTGTDVFPSRTPMKVLMMHCTQPPERPSQRVPGLRIAPELERLVLDLLAKERDLRPADAEALARRLDALPVGEWTQEEARRERARFRSADEREREPS